MLDGAAIIHCLPTKAMSTFSEYADKVFISYVNKQLQHSLKEEREVAKGAQKKVSGQTKLPGNWIDFLPDPSSKKELSPF